jgi:alkylation response protein AidB-like acyl-CoA dehydrogenase
VDFELTDEQRLFQRTLRDFADKEIVPVAQELERTGTYPAKILRLRRKSNPIIPNDSGLRWPRP